jgi:hypothetical protein
MKQKDLDKFWKQYYPAATGTDIKVVGPNGGLFAGVEASLDIQYISTMGFGVKVGSDQQHQHQHPTAPHNPADSHRPSPVHTRNAREKTEFWSFDGNAPDNKQNEPFLDWLLLVGNTTDAEVPKVFSTSYGEVGEALAAPCLQNYHFQLPRTHTLTTGHPPLTPHLHPSPSVREHGLW